MSASSIAADGYAIIAGVITAPQIQDCLKQIDGVLAASDASIKNRQGIVYAARNIVDELPQLNRLWRAPQPQQLLRNILGDQYRLVRGLYFDKHPQRSWTLPWHKDMTIAVRDNARSSSVFAKPTTKLGVPHVEAPTSVLQNMLTLRFHLDDVTTENGPLEVIPGSHLNGKKDSGDQREIQKLLVSSGDVVAMRPLLSHASGKSVQGTTGHRRVVHFEFSGDRELPDGYQWYYEDQTSPESLAKDA